MHYTRQNMAPPWSTTLASVKWASSGSLYPPWQRWNKAVCCGSLQQVEVFKDTLGLSLKCLLGSVAWAIHLCCSLIPSLTITKLGQFSLRFLAFGPLETAGTLADSLVISAVLRWKCTATRYLERTGEGVAQYMGPWGSPSSKNCLKASRWVWALGGLKMNVFPLIAYRLNSNVTVL